MIIFNDYFDKRGNKFYSEKVYEGAYSNSKFEEADKAATEKEKEIKADDHLTWYTLTEQRDKTFDYVKSNN